MTHHRSLAALAAAVLLSASLAACGAGKKKGGDGGGPTGAGGGSGSSGPITVGTTDKIVALDPAGSYDLGSQQIETQIYQYLMAIPAGGTQPQPDAAQSCEFTKPTEYTCKIRPNQKFSNGDPLTAKDVAFSFQRIVKINDPNGPASLLANMASVAAPDDDTVVFTLKASDANDQTWPFILGTDAGPIVDSKVFPADKLLPDDKAVGSGPYKITSYSKNQLLQFAPNTYYGGANKPKTGNITLKYYASSDNLKLDIQTGAIDVAWRSLTPTDIEDLRGHKDVKVLTGPGGALQYIVFNFKTMPGDSDAQKLAIRHAVAYSVDRSALASKVFKGTYQAAYSMLPDGLPGHIDAFKDQFGASPDKAKASAELQQAGVKTPVALKLEYTSDHYGPTSDQLYNEIKRQLEGTGLFTVSLQSTEWDTYQDQRVQDAYPIYQLGWFPDFPDADNYLSPFLVENNFVHAHYCDPGAKNRPCDQDKMAAPLSTEETKAEAARIPAFQQLQKTLATGTMPYLPLLEGQQIAVTRSNIGGVQDTLDISFLFRFWTFTKG